MVIGFGMSIEYVVERYARGAAWSSHGIEIPPRSYHNSKPHSSPYQYFNPDNSLAQLMSVPTCFSIEIYLVLPPAPPEDPEDREILLLDISEIPVSRLR